jgi:hypothetical protein
MSALTIQFGEVPFENLGPFNNWDGPGGAGMYVVLVQPNREKAPTDYRALFFGEADNLSSTEFFRIHPKFRCCVSEAERADNLFFAISPLEGSTADQRKQIVQMLANEFRTACNY